MAHSLASDSWWSAGDRGSMMLGMYESEVLEVLHGWKGHADVFIDVGAADGYYAIGCVKSGIVEHAICYEISPSGQQVIARQAETNGVVDRMTILGEAKADFVADLVEAHGVTLSRAILLMDIEGSEFDVLTGSVIRDLADCRMIIELHEDSPGNRLRAEELIESAKEHFTVRVITQGPRNPASFVELHDWTDDDRWILCSESRGYVMRWLVCEPKL
jgi:hypothetical protein